MGLSESLCNENTECQWRNGSCPIAKGSFSFLLLVRWRQQQIVYNHGEDALLTRSMVVVVVVVVNCQHGYVAFCTVMSFTKETATTAGVKHYTGLQSSDDKSRLGPSIFISLDAKPVHRAGHQESSSVTTTFSSLSLPTPAVRHQEA